MSPISLDPLAGFDSGREKDFWSSIILLMKITESV